MNSKLITELKQFISLGLTGLETRIGGLYTKIDEVDSNIDGVEASLSQQIQQLDQKVDDLMAGVGDSFDSFDKVYQEQLDAHQQLFAKLGV